MIVFHERLTPQNKFSARIRSVFPIPVQHRSYYFVMRDCSKSIVNEYFRKETRLNFELEVRNGKDYHGADERAIGYLLPGLLIMTLVMVFLVNPKRKNLFEEN